MTSARRRLRGEARTGARPARTRGGPRGGPRGPAALRPALAGVDPGRPAGRLGCALAGAALLALAGRPWGLGWLAVLAFVPLLAALHRERHALAAACQAAVAALPAAFVAYEAIGPFAPAALPALALAASLPFALVGALTPRLRRALGPRALLCAFPFLWLAAETLPGKPWLLGRFATPLFAVGYTQAGLPAMQLARVGGVGAVSLAVLAGNALLALALLERARWALAALAAMTLAVAVVAAAPVGYPPAAGAGAGSPGTIAVRVVQEALPDAAYAAAALLPEARAALVGAYVERSLAAPLPPGPGLTVWPEGALPGPLPSEGPSGLEPLLAGLGPTIAGAPARTPAGATAGPGGIANAAYAWRRGSMRHVYDKRHLAPITEDALVPGRLPALTTLGGVRVAPLICFEAAFPALARGAARLGAQLLVVLTNDGFGRHLGTPIQHLRVARFRAVETGLPLAFASNAGPSAVIDGRGRVLGRTRAGRAAALVATPRLAAGPTPYLRWGDWPGTVALAAAGLLALVSGARGGSTRD